MDVNDYIKVELLKDNEEMIELIPDEPLCDTGRISGHTDFYGAEAVFSYPLSDIRESSLPSITDVGNVETHKILSLKISRMKEAVLEPDLGKKIPKKAKLTKDKEIRPTEPKKSIVACSICGEEFMNMRAFNKHCLEDHSLEGPCYNCPQCSNTFLEQKLLKIHRRSCITDDSFKKNINCINLKKNLNTNLKRHKHPESFSCEVCEKTFKTKGNLKIHQVHHTGEKNYPCSICDKSFRSNSYLKIHILWHSNIKLYKCHICDKSFGRQNILTKHLLVHNGIRPFQCDFCTKAFRAKDKLVVHQRTHTGEKPYKCGLCPVAFCDSSNLKKHKKTVHKDVPLL